MKQSITILILLILLTSCDKKQDKMSLQEEVSLQDKAEEQLNKIDNTPTYTYPELESVLRRSLDLRTFELPSFVMNNEMMVIADLNGQKIYGQPLSDYSKYLTVTRSARGSELVCCYHDEERGFSTAIVYDEHVHWKFTDPNPKVQKNKVILATAILENGQEATLYIGKKEKSEQLTAP